MARPVLDVGSPTVRFQMKVPSSFMQRVNNYRHENRISSLSEAIRKLVEEALDASEAA